MSDTDPNISTGQTADSTGAAGATTTAAESTQTQTAPEPKGIEKLMQDALKPVVTTAKAGDTTTQKAGQGQGQQKPPQGQGQGQSTQQPKPGKSGDVRANFAKLEQQLSETQKSDREKAAKISEYEKKIADIESKVKQSEADAKRVQEMEARINQLQGELSQTAYERSEDFKAKFVEPWNRQWNNTISLIKQLTIVEGDEMNQTKRQASDADFLKVFNAPVTEQANMAAQIFGNNASLVMNKIARLEDMRDQANAAVAAHKTDYEKMQQERTATTQKQQEEYDRYHNASSNELSEKYPQFFKPDEKDPEGSEALNNGYAFVDVSKNAKHPDGKPFTTEERAAYAAVIRARAAAFPLLVLQQSRQNAKIEALEKELQKYRGSSPGPGSETTSGDGKQSERKGKGIAGLASEF